MKAGKCTVLVVVFVMSICCVGTGMVMAGEKGKPEKVSLGYVDAQDSKTAAPDLSSLATVHPEKASVDTLLRLTGSLVADEKSDVASTANGIVQKVNVERGSLVEKDAVLAEVDPTDAQNMLNEGLAGVDEICAALGWNEKQGPFRSENQPGVKTAKAAFELAESNFKRYSELHAQQAISRLAYDQAKTEYETARQRLEQAQHQAKQLYQSYCTAMTRLETMRKMVRDTTIKAPFSGWVSEKYVSEGERVTTNPMGAGAKIVTLMKIDPIRLVVAIPQQYASLVAKGQQIKFSVDTYPGKTFIGDVRYVNPSLESNSRALTIEALVSNSDKVLRPGFFASAELILPEKRQCLVIPASALQKEGDVSTVKLVREGKLVSVVVAVDELRDGNAYLSSGLMSEDAVVIHPATSEKKDTVSAAESVK